MVAILGETMASLLHSEFNLPLVESPAEVIAL